MRTTSQSFEERECGRYKLGMKVIYRNTMRNHWRGELVQRKNRNLQTKHEFFTYSLLPGTQMKH